MEGSLHSTPTADELQRLFDLPNGQGPMTVVVPPPEPPLLTRLDTARPDLSKWTNSWAPGQSWLDSEVGQKQKDMICIALPDAIRRLRKYLGISQEQMSRKLGLTSNSVRVWESKHTQPCGSAILMLLRLCPDAESLAWFGISASPNQR